ncbi:hypothetical protein DQ239_09895 [Blastococcus sp. TF02-09]|uniref:hypothetical protein n=1 Tax=Blastococcus sp. TF02-09 TaxID=2250576 RepID=UPI000DE97894|nr:hypothetical protein [Blastococcus sp. TF02-9]RBY78004.1 hypothetical protein DQ239_09895 [Blastococcus sp. TF02-9]
MPDPAPASPTRRTLAFGVVVLLCLTALATYLLVQRSRDAAAAEAAADREAATSRLQVEDVLEVPHLVVRNTAPGPSFGKVALIPLDDPTGPRAIVDVACDRISATPSGALCLQQVTGMLTTYRAVFLDEQLREVGAAEVGGVPSRARVSAGGSWGASTVFVSGHAYTDAQFSTETLITDLTTRTSLGNLETWTTVRDGEEITAVDRNYWGVSFIGDGPGFYATLGTGDRIFLVKGDVGTRTMEVVGTEGGCPSVSPDGRTVVYKEVDPESRNEHFVAAGLAEGDLDGRPAVPLGEGRLVDDQVAWLDDDTVLYAVGRGVSSSVDFDVWSSPVDGGAPTLLIPDAASPSVVIPEG